MGTPTVANDWTDEYESIVEFYFWEPQHLNRRAPPGRNPGIDEVLQRLRRKEVPLNHLLGILFRLIPASLSARLLSSIAGVPIGSTARFVNNADLRRSSAYGACQPDFVFQIRDGLAFVEVKVEAKTSAEQLAKYATFAACQKTEGKVVLILLGKTARFAEADCFSDLASGKLPFGKKASSSIRRLGLEASDVARQFRRMELYCSSFTHLHAALEAEARRLGGLSEGDQVLANLICGMRDALVRLRVVVPTNRR